MSDIETTKKIKEKIVKKEISIEKTDESQAIRVKRIRGITGLTQKQFADKYNIPYKTLVKWEQNVIMCAEYTLDLLEFKVKYDYSK